MCGRPPKLTSCTLQRRRRAEPTFHGRDMDARLWDAANGMEHLSRYQWIGRTKSSKRTMHELLGTDSWLLARLTVLLGSDNVT